MSLTFDLRTVDGRTVIDFEGRQSAAVIVQSDDGEEIYLPQARESEGDGPPSSYQSAEGDPEGPPSSYQPAGDAATGRTGTAGGFRIVHPEPVTDVRVVTG